MREAPFVMVYHAELELLSGDLRALQVWLHLVRHADFQQQTCYPSCDRLAKLTKSSESTVRRALQRLKDMGLLEYADQRHPDCHTNVFHLARLTGAVIRDTPPGEGCHSCAEGVSPVTGGGCHSCAEGVSPVTPKQEPEHNQRTTTKERDPNGGGGGNDFSSITRRERSARVKLEERLRATGLAEWETAIREAERNGISHDDVLQLCETYEAKRKKFHGPGALLYRISKGDWPVDGVSLNNSPSETNHQQRDEGAWLAKCYEAVKLVRSKTPKGSYVDDREVVKYAIAQGVPEWFALQERGLATPTTATADNAA